MSWRHRTREARARVIQDVIREQRERVDKEPDQNKTMNTKTQNPRATMNGKPVHHVPAKSVINFASGFAQKLLCDGLTFTAGSACAYSCAFCYVPDMMQKSTHVAGLQTPFEQNVIRRDGAIEAMRSQLTDRHGRPKFLTPEDRRVIYASPLVDVAANMELVRETVEACKVILELTNWQIRLLSKSNLLPKVAELLQAEEITPALNQNTHPRDRVIYGVSTGTLDDKLAHSIEADTPLVSKRIASLHWLQDHGFRTFGMICPSLPQTDYVKFAEEMADAIRWHKCEHVWAEVINARGESFTRTHRALVDGGLAEEAALLRRVSHDRSAWEAYARQTFNAHAEVYGHGGKLRFLQYVTKETRDWWAARQNEGAILL